MDLDTDMATQLTALGAKPEPALHNAPAEGPSGDAFDVVDSNREPLLAFLSLETQWRLLAVPIGSGATIIHLGIDYAAATALMSAVWDSRRRPKRVSRMMEQIQMMERAALPILNGGEA
jgi:hypothetical protein